MEAVLVALMAQKAEVKFDPAYVMAGQIATRVTELGYPATLMENETTGQGIVELSVRLPAAVYFAQHCRKGAKSGQTTPKLFVESA